MIDRMFQWAEDYPGRAAAVIVLTCLLAPLYIGYRLDQLCCRRLGEAASVRTKYDLVAGGCFVRLNGRWVPAKAWRGIE